MAITHSKNDVGATVKVATINTTTILLTMLTNLDYLYGSFSARDRPCGILDLVAYLHLPHAASTLIISAYFE
jgi:hypothetical protein